MYIITTYLHLPLSPCIYLYLSLCLPVVSGVLPVFYRCFTCILLVFYLYFTCTGCLYMQVLGRDEQFEHAVKLVITDVSLDNDIVVSVFETNIRMLG